MNGQPQEEWVVELNKLSEEFLSLEEDKNSFKARLFHKNIRSLHEKYPTNLKVLELYSVSFSVINKIDQSIKLFENLILPSYNPDLAISYIEIYTKYISLLYFNHNYKKALNVLLDLEKFKEKAEVDLFYTLSLDIYFENNLYNEIIRNYFLKLKANPNSIILRDRIYLMFSYYYLGDIYKVYECLKVIKNVYDNNKVDSENIFELMKRELLEKIFKTEITDLEAEFLEKIKQVNDLYTKYSIEEIYFDEKICFHDKEFTMNVERSEDGGFCGKIPNIDGCYTQGETLEELKENMLEVLEMASEEELIIA